MKGLFEWHKTNCGHTAVPDAAVGAADDGVCAACQYEGTETIPALGHDLTTTDDEPTCTAPEYRTTTCSRCDYTETRTLDMISAPAIHVSSAKARPGDGVLTLRDVVLLERCLAGGRGVELI